MHGYFLRGLGERLADLSQFAAVLGLLELLLHQADVLKEVSLTSIENVRHLICMAGELCRDRDCSKWIRRSMQSLNDLIDRDGA